MKGEILSSVDQLSPEDSARINMERAEAEKGVFEALNREVSE